ARSSESAASTPVAAPVLLVMTPPMWFDTSTMKRSGVPGYRPFGGDGDRVFGYLSSKVRVAHFDSYSPGLPPAGIMRMNLTYHRPRVVRGSAAIPSASLRSSSGAMRAPDRVRPPARTIWPAAARPSTRALTRSVSPRSRAYGLSNGTSSAG